MYIDLWICIKDFTWLLTVQQVYIGTMLYTLQDEMGFAVYVSSVNMYDRTDVKGQTL